MTDNKKYTASELTKISYDSCKTRNCIDKIMKLCKKEAENGKFSAIYLGGYDDYENIITILKEQGLNAKHVVRPGFLTEMCIVISWGWKKND